MALLSGDTLQPQESDPNWQKKWIKKKYNKNNFRLLKKRPDIQGHPNAYDYEQLTLLTGILFLIDFCNEELGTHPYPTLIEVHLIHYINAKFSFYFQFNPSLSNFL